MIHRWLVALAVAMAAACSPLAPAPSSSAPAAGAVEVVWLGQSAFKITSPSGKVIVTDPWLRTNPLTPAAYKQLDGLGQIDVLLVSHGHFDHIADAPALAQIYNVPLRGPGDLLNTLMTLGVLPANLLPRMNKGGTVEPVPGIRVTAVRAEHSSIYVWRNPATNKDETHPGGEAIGWIIELENGFRIYHAGDTAVFGDMRLIGERYRPDLALVPIGGHFTMDRFDAVTAVGMIEPQQVIPCHYNTFPPIEADAQAFKQDVQNAGFSEVVVLDPGQSHTLR